MYNGSLETFMNSYQSLGYDPKKELKENRSRLDQNLPLLKSRMAKTTDINQRNQNIYASDGNFVTGKITISTSANQVPIAPGKMIREWKENNRTYRTYSIAKHAPFNWCLGSGNYKEYSSKNQETKKPR